MGNNRVSAPVPLQWAAYIQSGLHRGQCQCQNHCRRGQGAGGHGGGRGGGGIRTASRPGGGIRRIGARRGVNRARGGARPKCLRRVLRWGQRRPHRSAHVIRRSGHFRPANCTLCVWVVVLRFTLAHTFAAGSTRPLTLGAGESRRREPSPMAEPGSAPASPSKHLALGCTSIMGGWSISCALPPTAGSAFPGGQNGKAHAHPPTGDITFLMAAGRKQKNSPPPHIFYVQKMRLLFKKTAGGGEARPHSHPTKTPGLTLFFSEI